MCISLFLSSSSLPQSDPVLCCCCCCRSWGRTLTSSFELFLMVKLMHCLKERWLWSITKPCLIEGIVLIFCYNVLMDGFGLCEDTSFLLTVFSTRLKFSLSWFHLRGAFTFSKLIILHRNLQWIKPQTIPKQTFFVLWTNVTSYSKKDRSEGSCSHQLGHDDKWALTTCGL